VGTGWMRAELSPGVAGRVQGLKLRLSDSIFEAE